MVKIILNKKFILFFKKGGKMSFDSYWFNKGLENDPEPCGWGTDSDQYRGWEAGNNARLANEHLVEQLRGSDSESIYDSIYNYSTDSETVEEKKVVLVVPPKVLTLYEQWALVHERHEITHKEWCLNEKTRKEKIIKNRQITTAIVDSYPFMALAIVAEVFIVIFAFVKGVNYLIDLYLS